MWLARCWTERIPALQVLAEVTVETVGDADCLYYKGVLFPARPLLVLSSRATALKTPWTRVDIGLKLDQFQRAGLMKLDETVLPFMADYVCLIQAFCWLTTVSMGRGPLALHCRSALRQFWLRRP